MSVLSAKDKKEKELLREARARSNIYSFLALLYAKEPNLILLRQIRNSDFIHVLSSLGVEFENDFLEKSGQALLTEMVEEYTRLFIGPGKHISPHESVHREGEGLLWGASTAKVKAFIESSGLRYASDFKGIPDHISVELEFMQKLIQYEADAWDKQNQNKAIRSMGLEKRFIKEHLIRWIPKFSDMVIRETRLSFYREMAKLTKEYIIFEAKKLAK